MIPIKVIHDGKRRGCNDLFGGAPAAEFSGPLMRFGGHLFPGSAVCRVILRWQSAVVRRAPVPAGWFQQAVCSCVCSASNPGEGEFRTRIFLRNPVLCESSRLCQMMKPVITLCARGCVGKRIQLRQVPGDMYQYGDPCRCAPNPNKCGKPDLEEEIYV